MLRLRMLSLRRPSLLTMMRLFGMRRSAGRFGLAMRGLLRAALSGGVMRSLLSYKLLA